MGLQYEQSEVADQMDLLRAQAKGQEFDEAKAQDKIEAQLERDMVRGHTHVHTNLISPETEREMWGFEEPDTSFHSQVSHTRHPV